MIKTGDEVSKQEVSGDTTVVTELTPEAEPQPIKTRTQSFRTCLVRLISNDDLDDGLWSTIPFKGYVLICFGLSSWVVCKFGI